MLELRRPPPIPIARAAAESMKCKGSGQAGVWHGVRVERVFVGASAAVAAVRGSNPGDALLAS